MNDKAIWDDIAKRFKAKDKWLTYYVNHAYKRAIDIGLGHIKKINSEKINLLKTDLWNETIEQKRDILSNLLNEQLLELYAIDISENICDIAQQKLNNVHIKTGDIRHIPFADNFFDIVVDLSTLDHIAEVEAQIAIEEYFRVLKPNGILVLVFWYNSISVKYILSPLLKYIISKDDQTPQYFFSLSSVKNTILKHFNLLKEGYLGTLLCHPYIGLPLSLLPKIINKRIFNFFVSLEYNDSMRTLLKHLGGLYLFIGRKK